MKVRYSQSRVIARIRRLDERRLEALIETGAVQPAEVGGERHFAEADLARLELLCELIEDFDLDEEAAAMVIGLIDQIHGLRRQMRRLLAALEAEPEEVRARIREALAGGEQ